MARESPSSPSSLSSSCPNDDLTLNVEVSSISCTSGTCSATSKTTSSVVRATLSSPTAVTTTIATCISSTTMVTTFSTMSPSLAQERVKVVRPTFLPFSPLKFQPLYPRKSSRQGEADQTLATSGSISFPSSSTTCSSSLASTPQTVPNADRCQSFPKKSCGSEAAGIPGSFAKSKAVEDLSMYEGDGPGFAREQEPANVSTPSAEDFLNECILELESVVDNHLNISDSQITILVDPCPDNNLNIEEPKDGSMTCCRSCSELFPTEISTSSTPSLQKSFSSQTIDRKKTDETIPKNNSEKKEGSIDPPKTPTSLSLYFKWQHLLLKCSLVVLSCTVIVDLGVVWPQLLKSGQKSSLLRN